MPYKSSDSLYNENQNLKKQIEELKIEKNSLREILSLIPENIYWFDKNGLCLGCSDKLKKALKGDIVGKYLSEILPKNHLEAVLKNNQKVIESDQPLVIEEIGCDTENEAVYLSHKIPLHNKKGEVTGILGVSIDITERKKYEKSLQKEKEKLERAQEVTADFIAKMKYEITGQRDGEQKTEQNVREIRDYLEHILSLIPGNIYWKDRAGKYLFSNANALKIIGFNSYKDIVGKTNYDIFDKHLADLTTVVDEKVMGNNKECSLEETGLDTDGNPAIYLTRKIPLHDLKGNVIGLLGVSIDITDRKKAEALQKEKDLAQKTSSFMQLITGAMAHELRTPLRTISSGALGLKKYLPSLIQAYELAKTANLDVFPIPKMHYEALPSVADNIESEANAAFSIIDMLFVKSGMMNLDLTQTEKCSISTCIDEALQRYPFAADEKKKVIWSAKNSSDFEFTGKKILIIHVIFNLLKNALYYLKVAAKGEIQIWLECGTKYNILHFKDTGTGIAMEILPHIFERFFSHTLHGTGIGLAFCKMVMQNFGGDITCESVAGAFTKFNLKFPKN